MNVKFPDFDQGTVARQESVLVPKKHILKYIGAKGHYFFNLLSNTLEG